jgi:MYXO-CTERM domain-containing protein
MTKERLCALLLCAAGMLPGARAAQISQGFNSILTLPGAGGGAVDNSTPPASNQVYQNSVTVVDQDAAYYAAKAAAAFGAPVVAPASAPTLTPNPTTSGDVGNALLDTNPNLKAVLPASMTLETATVPGLTGAVTGTVTLPSFIVPDPPPVTATASFDSGFVPWDQFGAFDIDAPEPGGASLGVLGLASLAAVGAWRRRSQSVRPPC